jgi:hypothetical protein
MYAKEVEKEIKSNRKKKQNSGDAIIAVGGMDCLGSGSYHYFVGLGCYIQS